MSEMSINGNYFFCIVPQSGKQTHIIRVEELSEKIQ